MVKESEQLEKIWKTKFRWLDGLIQSLGLDGLETESHFDPKNDDIADWFSGSPDWVRRS